MVLSGSHTPPQRSRSITDWAGDHPLITPGENIRRVIITAADPSKSWSWTQREGRQPRWPSDAMIGLLVRALSGAD
jgi:hypothetical protein